MSKPASAAPRTVVLFTNSVAPYRIWLFNDVSARLAALDLHFRVCFMTEQLKRRSWRTYWHEIEFDYTLLPGREVGIRGGSVIGNWGWRRELRQAACVVFGGWETATVHLASLACGRRRIPTIVWSGTTTASVRRSGAVASAVRGSLVRRAASCVAYGVDAAKFLHSLGVDPARVFTGVNLGDVRFFGEDGRQQADPSDVAVFVGGLSKNYGADLLPELADRVPLEGVVVVGDGPMRSVLESHNKLDVRGHLSREDVRAALTKARALLIPFRNAPFSIVASEALAAEVPVILSVRDGARELIADGVNGFAVEPTVEAFAAAWHRLPSRSGLEHPLLRRSGSEYTEAFVRAVEMALNDKRNPPRRAT